MQQVTLLIVHCDDISVHTEGKISFVFFCQRKKYLVVIVFIEISNQAITFKL